MNSSRDPFGFEANPPPVQGTDPIIIIAQPGQELRIVVPDESGSVPGIGDSKASGKGSGDSKASGKGSGDSKASGPPRGVADLRDPFGFAVPQRRFSPSPLTIIARAGQEIRVVVAKAGTPSRGFSGDSKMSGPGKGDRR